MTLKRKKEKNNQSKKICKTLTSCGTSSALIEIFYLKKMKEKEVDA